MSVSILSLRVAVEDDIVVARQRARQLAALLGFDSQEQVRIATAVSEIARNAFRYAKGGRLSFAIEGRVAPQVLQITLADRGPGIARVNDVLTGAYKSPTGMGLGISGSRRLMDRFHIETAAGHGTTVTMGKLLPIAAPLVTTARVAEITSHLAAERAHSMVDEIQQQNRELLATLDQLRRRQDDLLRLNSELEDTNRGVVALYAELDEKADHLRRADEMKSKFLSNMSHEFRTPLNSMLALTRLLLERTDGDLTSEQEIQVRLVQRSAEDLSEIVNDLLDLAKVEAGKIVVHPTEFEVRDLFGALRGMLRPLLVGDSVTLVFEAPQGVPTLHTDEAKVSQVLRNFISNALKFTEHGEVRVRSSYSPIDRTVRFEVSDTGIGIAPDDQERIFLEFTQVDSPAQRKVRGTGLGLPLSRRLAELLGGELGVTSAVGAGSTFFAVIPAFYAGQVAPAIAPSLDDVEYRLEAGVLPVLVIEDSPDAQLVYSRMLRGSRFQMLEATSLAAARQWLKRVTPAAIVLDIVMQGEDSWKFLSELKGNDLTSSIPVVVISAVEDQRKGLALGADDYAVKPVERDWLLTRLRELTTPPGAASALLIDDDPGIRYVLRRLLLAESFAVFEARDGIAGLRTAAAERPAVIFLDLVMPSMPGREVLSALKGSAATRDIPVIIATSRILSPEEKASLSRDAAAILPKDLLAGEQAAAHIREVLCRAGVAQVL
jgi:signal transduction histidine kinase/DNA-binding response OmpR family regulator